VTYPCPIWFSFDEQDQFGFSHNTPQHHLNGWLPKTCCKFENDLKRASEDPNSHITSAHEDPNAGLVAITFEVVEARLQVREG
jgi:hypothetical protein